MGVIRRFEILLEAASAICLFALMLIVLIDVVGRDFFNHPLSFATEVLEIVVAAMVFLVYPILGLREANITVDLFHASPKVQRLQRIIGGLFGAVAFALIAWCLGRQGMRVLDYGDASPILGIPTGDVLVGMSVLGSLTALAFVAAVCRRLGRPASLRPAVAPKEALS